MLKNYFKIAFRNLWKNKVFSGVNMAGLALGIAAFVLILEYISFEKSVNGFHANLPTLYRMLWQNKAGEVWPDMAPAVATLMKQQFPEVKTYCRVVDNSISGIVSASDGKNRLSPKAFRETDVAYADASFFTLFTFPLLQGDAATALTRPNTVAVSESYARKYFGDAKALGQLVTMNNQFGTTPFTVSAVYADMPQNSDMQFGMVFSLQTLANPANLNGNDWARLDSFDGSYLMTYLQLPEGTDTRKLEDKFDQLKQKIRPPDENRMVLQPAATIHLGASLSDPYPTTGKLAFVYLLGGIAVLILAIAWFNYINLSTAGALKRAKEVGVRKVVGAGQRQLIGQFLGESFLLNLLGFGLAILLISGLQTVFNELIKKELSLRILTSNSFWLIGLCLLLVGALASGGYTAFALSSFQPLQTLKGAFGNRAKGGSLRKSLVVFQFSVSVVLIICTFVLYRQLQFMQNQHLGVSLEQRVVIHGPEVGKDESFQARTAAFQHELEQVPSIKNFSSSGTVPGNFYNFSTSGIVKQNPQAEADKIVYSMGFIDHRYLTTYGIALAAGRNFLTTECEAGYVKSGKLMVNETGARRLGFPSAADAVGKIINWGQAFEIVGVVKDYHHQSLREAIDPIIFMPSRYGNWLTIQLGTDQIQAKMGALERLYKATYPGNPFEFFFVDENYNQQYQTEQQYGKIFVTASLLAIFIACLGLFGLATFMTEQRTKEIGVRKVLGASVGSIVTLLSKDFMKLVLIAFLIASPIAWYATRQWLQNFEYKVDLEWWVFGLAGGTAVLVALATISFQSIKAALMNPVSSLRSE
ncbi:ABC transporter permease [Larkinella humicola]|uniref:FtsX-like permease family protein n=1 Tax=Larkinella humicola TaxID=2607654 RepID=A0A5N1JBW1_9BACT|nr:ABC transporter permease [Larkinella humicola]KAA9349971.1 FtsX-like permease family protein [Larkinella humicola]